MADKRMDGENIPRPGDNFMYFGNIFKTYSFCCFTHLNCEIFLMVIDSSWLRFQISEIF